jgi:hypothetical protein
MALRPKAMSHARIGDVLHPPPPRARRRLAFSSHREQGDATIARARRRHGGSGRESTGLGFAQLPTARRRLEARSAGDGDTVVGQDSPAGSSSMDDSATQGNVADGWLQRSSAVPQVRWRRKTGSAPGSSFTGCIVEDHW